MCLSYLTFPSSITLVAAKYQFLKRHLECGSDSRDDSEATAAKSVDILLLTLLPVGPFKHLRLKYSLVVHISTENKPI